MARPAIAFSLLLLAGAAAASASAPARVIQADRNVGGIKLGRATAPQAAALFASDGVRNTRRHTSSCVVSWYRIGLTVEFGVIGTDPTNPCIGGTAFVVTITSRFAWRTSVGLRVGDSAARLRRLYPGSRLHAGEAGGSNGFWLVTRHLCSTVGGGIYPGLLARVAGGRVTAMVAGVGICD